MGCISVNPGLSKLLISRFSSPYLEPFLCLFVADDWLEEEEEEEESEEEESSEEETEKKPAVKKKVVKQKERQTVLKKAHMNIIFIGHVGKLLRSSG